MHSQFKVGQLVRIKPEYSDGAGDQVPFIVVTSDEGKGRLDIAPAQWDYAKQGAVRPTELVRCFMIEAV